MGIPLVTISSAFYNTGPLILDMLKSVFSQTFTDWELLLINDGSTDDTLAIAESINDSRIRIYSNDKNRGRAFSLNRVSERARGKYIARMDADDLCSPARIQKQVELIESDPDLDVVGTGICYLDKQDNPVGDTGTGTKKTHEEICREPARTFGLCHGSILGKKEWFSKNPYQENLQLGIDFNLWLRTYRHSKFGNIAEPLYYYRLDNSFNLKKQLIVRKDSAKFLFDYYRQYGTLSQALKYASVQHLKFAAALVLFALGQRKRLMAKRFKPLEKSRVEFYKNEIQFIKSFQLPVFENVETA